jgi:hypothetical protein
MLVTVLHGGGLLPGALPLFKVRGHSIKAISELE